MVDPRPMRNRIHCEQRGSSGSRRIHPGERCWSRNPCRARAPRSAAAAAGRRFPCSPSSRATCVPVLYRAVRTRSRAMQQHVRIARFRLLVPKEWPSQCVYKTVLKSVLELTTVPSLCQGNSAYGTKVHQLSHFFDYVARYVLEAIVEAIHGRIDKYLRQPRAFESLQPIDDLVGCSD